MQKRNPPGQHFSSRDGHARSPHTACFVGVRETVRIPNACLHGCRHPSALVELRRGKGKGYKLPFCLPAPEQVVAAAIDPEKN